MKSMSLTKRARRYVRARGAPAAFLHVFRFLWRRAFRREGPILARRRELGALIDRRVGGTVVAGPLTGFKISQSTGWGAHDRASMLLGLYEAPVQSQLAKFSAQASTLIDIGAADGFFGVGAVAAGLFERSICFERDPISREALLEVVRKNDVEGRVIIYSDADGNMCATLRSGGVQPKDAVILCDIEGGEFELLTDQLLDEFCESPMIIELHDRLLPDGKAKLANLIASAERHFQVDTIAYGARDPSSIPLLHEFGDDDRWLICSEGRQVFQQWLVLTPKVGPSATPGRKSSMAEKVGTDN